MITIQSGKLTIPEEDRFVGFAGDNLSTQKQFVYLNRADTDSIYKLYLRFDDDSVKGIELSCEQSGDDLILTWQIRAEDLLRPGIVMAQIKIESPGGAVAHTGYDYFVAAAAAELDGDGSDVALMTRAEYDRDSRAMLEAIRDSMPYIGAGGFWYLYDPEQGEYVRTNYQSAGVPIDSAMSDESFRPVSNSVVKAYVDQQIAGRVSTDTHIAGLALSGDIERADLVQVLAPKIFPPLVWEERDFGYTGQFGRSLHGHPLMCEAPADWRRLAYYSELEEKMDYAPVTSAEDIADLSTGQVFMTGGKVCLKTADGYIALADQAATYTKAEINATLGDLETLLAAI